MGKTQRLVAVSQDLCGWGGCGSSWYKKGQIMGGDKVKIECTSAAGEESFFTGEFTVVDTMNERFTNKFDVFDFNKSLGRCTEATLYIKK